MGELKALVIGASGLVGRALMRVLENAQADVVGTYASRPGSSLVRVDIGERSQVRNCLERMGPQVIFLAGALTHVDYCEDHPDEARRVNVDGARHVAEEAARVGAKVVYYSSDYVFDGNNGPYDEDAEACPVSIYGQSKLDGESIVRSTSADNLILRTTVVYGWERSSKNFAMQVYQRLQSGLEMTVPEDQIGNPTLVDFLAEASLRLVQRRAAGVVNLVGRDLVSRFDFGRALAGVYGLNQDLIVPVSTEGLKQRAARPLRGGLKTEKLQRLLETEAMPLAEALKRLKRQWRADAGVSRSKTDRGGEADRLSEEISERVKRYFQLVHKERPFTPFKSPVPYAGRVFGAEEMVSLVDSALDFWLTLGPYGDLFESKLRTVFGARDFIFVNSGSSANLVAMSSLTARDLPNRLEAGDEVITPAVTFPSTLAPIVQTGLTPVFVDAEVGSYNINPHLVEEAVSPRTRAIFIPHTLGNPCDMDLIVDIAKRHQLYLIEDACDALGSTFRGKWVGTFGDLATLSFFPAHHITTGEGGGVVLNNPKLVKIARSLRDWGRDCWCAPGESNTCTQRFGWKLGELPPGYDHKYIYSHIGYNLKPTDLQAAIGVVQVDRLSDFVRRRRAHFDRFYEALEPFQDFITLPRKDARSEPAWFGFPICVKNGLSKRELVQWLETGKIETRAVFGGNILCQPGYAHIAHRVAGDLSQSNIIMRDSFFIGVYPGLTEEMMGFVIDRFKNFFNNVKRTKRGG